MASRMLGDEKAWRALEKVISDSSAADAAEELREERARKRGKRSAQEESADDSPGTGSASPSTSASPTPGGRRAASGKPRKRLVVEGSEITAKARAEVLRTLRAKKPPVDMLLCGALNASDNKLMHVLRDAISPFTTLITVGFSAEDADHICRLLPDALAADEDLLDSRARETGYRCLRRLRLVLSVCLLGAAAGLVGHAVYDELVRALAWTSGSCRLWSFSGDDNKSTTCLTDSCMENCHTTPYPCYFDVLVEEGVGRTPSFEGSMIVRNWALPLERDSSTEEESDEPRYRVKTLEALRCCDTSDHIAKSCCRFFDPNVMAFCDNWPQRQDVDGQRCPGGRWHCLFQWRGKFGGDGGREVTDLMPYEALPTQHRLLSGLCCGLAGAAVLLARWWMPYLMRLLLQAQQQLEALQRRWRFLQPERVIVKPAPWKGVGLGNPGNATSSFLVLPFRRRDEEVGDPSPRDARRDPVEDNVADRCDLGDWVEVRNGGTESWQLGVVTQTLPVKVCVEKGVSAEWAQVRAAESPGDYYAPGVPGAGGTQSEFRSTWKPSAEESAMWVSNGFAQKHPQQAAALRPLIKPVQKAASHPAASSAAQAAAAARHSGHAAASKAAAAPKAAASKLPAWEQTVPPSGVAAPRRLSRAKSMPLPHGSPAHQREKVKTQAHRLRQRQADSLAAGPRLAGVAERNDRRPASKLKRSASSGSGVDVVFRADEVAGGLPARRF
eukprot:TRINITY_DN39401_c0_g1_i1.p1 TRINITY_DN39401_c0_g1~~TRINITY_DN39401_c0_g1_i1.p1  ORF type:complete len:726 (-),score=141.77 TRINITY_DN39401_c0_g1_i1:244-2421(-)